MYSAGHSPHAQRSMKLATLFAQLLLWSGRRDGDRDGSLRWVPRPIDAELAARELFSWRTSMDGGDAGPKALCPVSR